MTSLWCDQTFYLEQTAVAAYLKSKQLLLFVFNIHHKDKY